MRSRTADDLGGRCPDCYLPRPCMCADVPRLAPRLRVVVVRHMLERNKSTNSARWAALALPNLEMHTYGLPGPPMDGAAWVTPSTWVLFPHAQPTPPPEQPPERLVVVDGSWPQARRILQRTTAFRGLPRLSLPPPLPRRRLRAQHQEEGMSTLEAIAGAYRLLGEPAVADALDALYDNAVRRAEKIRGRRTM